MAAGTPGVGSTGSPPCVDGAHNVSQTLGIERVASVDPYGARSAPVSGLVQEDIDRLTGTQAFEGNAVDVLVNGRASWTARQTNARQAAIILLKTYEFLDDPKGRELVELLRQRAVGGARVVIQYDFKGTVMFPRYIFERGIPAVLRPLMHLASVTLVPCHTPSGLHKQIFPCDHKKLFITLQKNAPAALVMGGMNVGSGYFKGGEGPNCAADHHGYRDTDVLVRGPVVRAAVDDFVRDVQTYAKEQVASLRAAIRDVACHATFRATAQPSRCRLVPGTPGHSLFGESILELFHHLLQTVPGGQTVLLSNACFVPPASTTRAIVEATRRGVKFRFLLNAPDVHDGFSRFAAFVSRGYMRKLWKKCAADSLEYYQWGASHVDNLCTIHHKIAVFGESGPVWVGSANQDGVSTKKNHEVVMLIEDARVRETFCDMFEADLARPNVALVNCGRLWDFDPLRHLQEEFLLATLGETL